MGQEEVYNFLLKNKGKKFATKQLSKTLKIEYHSIIYSLNSFYKFNEINREFVQPKDKGVGAYFMWWIDDINLKDGHERISLLYDRVKEKLLDMEKTRKDLENLIDKIKESKR